MPVGRCNRLATVKQLVHQSHVVLLKLRQNKTEDIREVIMNLSPAYERWHQETIAEGRTEGRTEGRAEGVVIGEARGRSLERVAVAKTMLREGLSIAIIKKVTGFSLAEIEQLGVGE
jgi:predicted transposase/invertase (TIGR01784 family)